MSSIVRILLADEREPIRLPRFRLTRAEKSERRTGLERCLFLSSEQE
jgi:hypothetical protein